jgi:UDP-glucuronate 4-epimerase
MAESNYLVTGAAGFIGSHLVEGLLARGGRVIGLDNFDDFYAPAIKRRNVEGALASDRFRLVEGDIRDTALVEDLLRSERVGTVFHLAARAGVRPSVENPFLYQSVNVEGTLSILEAMRNAEVKRLLFASSSSVYGDSSTPPFRETDMVDSPISPYAATKKAGEMLCHAYHHLHGIDMAILRFFTAYGPRQRPEMAIHKFTDLIWRGKTVPMYGDGGSLRDYTYVDDIVDGLLATLELAPGFEILNLGGADTTSLRDLIHWIAEELAVEPRIEYLPAQPGDVPVTYADVSKAARLLGYSPKVPIREGLRRFVSWYRERAEARRT